MSLIKWHKILFAIICMMSYLAWPQCGIAAAATTPTASAQTLDRIVAIVNDDIITQSQVKLMVGRDKQRLASMGQTNIKDSTLNQKALQQLIDQQLILQVAKQHGVIATQKEVDAAINRLAALNHFSIDKLKTQLAGDGITFKQFQQDVHNQIIEERMQNQVVGSKIVVTAGDVAAFKAKYQTELLHYSHFHLADFVIPLRDSPTQEQVQNAKAQAQKLAMALKQGVDPNKLTPPYDDLGWRTLAELPDVFVKPVSALKVNGVTDPLEAPNGFHVIKLLEVRTVGNHLTDDQIKRMIWQDKANKEMTHWAQQLRKTAYIKIMGQ